METVRVAGRKYSDPDVIALIKATGALVDPRSSVIHQARTLTAKLRHFDSIPESPIDRMVLLASLKGITVEPMDLEHQRNEKRDALLLPTASGRIIVYNPKRPPGRVAFSIGHEITHTFFPNSISGSRFRNVCHSTSREANELERLCDLGGSELLMPLDDFQAAAEGNYSLSQAGRLATVFGSSFEATVFRLATAHPGFAVAGLLRYRRRKNEERRIQAQNLQRPLFKRPLGKMDTTPRYRRQSCYLSESCGDEFTIRWNKSFDPSSVVYEAARDDGVHTSFEDLPNSADVAGRLEAIRDPFQREEAHPEFGDILFLWVTSEPGIPNGNDTPA